MSWINKGDLLEVDGIRVIAAGSDFTKMVYDDYDRMLMDHGIERGTAIGFVDVIYPDGHQRSIRLGSSSIKRIADGADATA